MEKLNCLEQVNHLGSKNFGFISSQGLVTMLESQGLTLNKVVEMKIRKNKELRLGYQKHRMLFDTQIKTNDGVLQLLVTNSHEGSSALTFQLGFFRYVCANGLVIGSNIIEPVKVRHTIVNAEKIYNTVIEIMAKTSLVIESIEKMKNKKITAEQLKQLEIKALELRGYNKEKHGQVKPLFEVKRVEDRNDDAFSVLNVIQENMLRTGFEVENEKGKIVKLRAIKSLDEQNRINSQLWDIFSQVA
jgi:hypothetical protein